MTSWPETADPWGGETDWSLVLHAAGAEPGAEANECWRRLIERYRQPVRQAVRRRLRGHPQSDDFADDFFAYVFEEGLLGKADRDRGRFRCFMQGVLRRYVLQELRRRAERRSVPLGDLDVAAEDEPSLEREEEAEWAAHVLQRAIEALLTRSPRDGELLLRAHGVPPFPQADVEALCSEFGLTRNAMHQAHHRARRTLRELVLAEIQSTVSSRADYEAERDVVVARLMEAAPDVLVGEEAH